MRLAVASLAGVGGVGLMGLCVVVSGAASVGAGPMVTARTVDLEQLTGRIESFCLDGGLRLGLEDGVRVIAAQDLVELRFDGAGGGLEDVGALGLRLVDGDMVWGRITSWQGGAVHLRHRHLGELVVPMQEVAEISRPGDAAGSSIGETALVGAGVGEQTVVLVNGDVVKGRMRRIGPEGLQVESGLGSLTVPLKLVAEAHLAEVRRDRIGVGLAARLFLTDGSRLTARRLRWGGQRVEARALGRDLRIDARWVVRVEVVGGRWVWLDELEPAAFEQTSWFDLRWRWWRGRNVLGGPIRLGGRCFEHGVGVHSASRLAYRLGGRFAWFVSQIGIDDDSGPYADATVQVYLDGREVFRAEHVRAGQEPQRLRVDVRGADRLELVVGFGANGAVQDRLDWADAALVRAGGSEGSE